MNIHLHSFQNHLFCHQHTKNCGIQMIGHKVFQYSQKQIDQDFKGSMLWHKPVDKSRHGLKRPGY